MRLTAFRRRHFSAKPAARSAKVAPPVFRVVSRSCLELVRARPSVVRVACSRCFRVFGLRRRTSRPQPLSQGDRFRTRLHRAHDREPGLFRAPQAPHLLLRAPRPPRALTLRVGEEPGARAHHLGGTGRSFAAFDAGPESLPVSGAKSTGDRVTRVSARTCSRRWASPSPRLRRTAPASGWQ